MLVVIETCRSTLGAVVEIPCVRLQKSRASFFVTVQLPTSFLKLSLMLLLLVTRPLPRDGGMAEDHGAPEAGQLPRVWTRGRKETESCQRVSGVKSP